MIYNRYKDIELSALGMGIMRLPVIDGDDSRIDCKEVEKMVDYAIEKGINYFDTAWGYHGGNSEEVIGKLLKKYPRESFYLADKFPGYDLNNIDKVEEIFEEQLERCQVDYFDFYLFHNVCEMNIKEYKDEKLGILEYLLKQKENGRIRHLGFSSHGSVENTREFLRYCGEHMEFAQLQINYLDWTFQEGKEKMELMKEYNLPVIIMEPLRGGRLAMLKEEEKSELLSIREGENPVSMAFRFIQSVPGVIVTLSGMSDFKQLKENIETFEENKPLAEEEYEKLVTAGKSMIGNSVPCTACRYCTGHCPKEIDIPYMIELYNERAFTGATDFITPMALMAVDEKKHPDRCISCGECEKVCPQGIGISQTMKAFAESLKG